MIFIKEKNRSKWAPALIVTSCLLLIIFLLSAWLTRKEKPEISSKLITTGFILTPNFSSGTGFYKEPQVIKLFSSNPHSRIYYTLDGSIPDTTSLLYTGPFSISSVDITPGNLSLIPTSPIWKAPLGEVYKGIVVNAISVHSGYKSRLGSATYFFDHKGRDRYSIPVMTLSGDPDDLFGYKHGIYVRGHAAADKKFYIRTKKGVLQGMWQKYPGNYTRRGMNWERPVTISYLEDGTNNGFTKHAGVRIHGNLSRSNEQKSLNIFFRGKYGTNKLDYNIFKELHPYPLHSFILRNSGQDNNLTMFRDAFVHAIFNKTTLDRQAYQPVILFINGEYWGLINIREKQDEDYLSIKYNLSSEKIEIISKKSEDTLPPAIQKLISFATSHDITRAVNYQKMEQLLDIDNFIDYLIANAFIAEYDWGFNNLELWRYSGSPDTNNKYSDGRWRWIFLDHDAAIGRTNSGPNTPSLQKLKQVTAIGPLFNSLIKNPVFKKKFFQRCETLLNTSFTTDILLAQLDQMQAVIAPAMQEHIDRWRTIPSYHQWEQNVEVMREFARKRPAALRKQLDELARELAAQPTQYSK